MRKTSSNPLSRLTNGFHACLTAVSGVGFGTVSGFGNRFGRWRPVSCKTTAVGATWFAIRLGSTALVAGSRLTRLGTIETAAAPNGRAYHAAAWHLPGLVSSSI